MSEQPQRALDATAERVACEAEKLARDLRGGEAFAVPRWLKTEALNLEYRIDRGELGPNGEPYEYWALRAPEIAAEMIKKREAWAQAQAGRA